MPVVAPSDRITSQPPHETGFSAPRGKLTLFTEWRHLEHAHVSIAPISSVWVVDMPSAGGTETGGREDRGPQEPRKFAYVQGISSGQKQDGIMGQNNTHAMSSCTFL